MFDFSVTADGQYVTLVLDDYTGKPQTWLIPRHAAAQMGAMLSSAATGTPEPAR